MSVLISIQGPFNPFIVPAQLHPLHLLCLLGYVIQMLRCSSRAASVLPDTVTVLGSGLVSFLIIKCGELFLLLMSQHGSLDVTNLSGHRLLLVLMFQQLSGKQVFGLVPFH